MFRFIAVLLIVLLIPFTALAQSHCFALSGLGAPVWRANMTSTDSPDQVRIRYIGHSMYHIQTYEGITVVTDYSGYIGAKSAVPDIVTMNHAHSSHYTDFPDPKIPNVLRGWDPNGGVAKHFLEIKDLLVRNVTSDIRSGFTGHVPDGNSVFIFEVGGLCIGHLGHLHQELSEKQYAAIGRIDVVMVPVDGGMTLPTDAMIRVMKRLKASVVLPMHWFGRSTLSRFLDGMKDAFEVKVLSDNDLVVSLRELPSRPTVMVMKPDLLPEVYE